MKEIVISNAFSLNMIPEGAPQEMWFKPLTLEEAKEIINKANTVYSIVGHADTASVLGNELGIEVAANRVSWQFNLDKHHFGGGQGEEVVNEQLLVGQYTGPRLPEGATTLPEGANIKWWLVDFFLEWMPM